MRKIYKYFIASILVVFISGCATPTIPPPHVVKVEPLNDQGSVVIETNGNVTRIYSIKSKD